MNLRVTQQTVTQTALSDSQRLTAQLASLQAQAASGKRLMSVSDDPTASLTILSSSAQDQLIGAHLTNVQAATTALNTSVSALQQVSSLFSAARSIGIEASNSVNNTTSFEALASQVDGLLGQLINLANTKQNNTYVFGGSNPSTQPFAVTTQDAQGRPLQVQYTGSADATSAIVDTHQQMAIYYPGSDVFMTRQRQAPVYAGNTGARVGAGTDTATGQRQLVLRHTTTTFALGSGVQTGVDSSSQDTILGAAGAHHLHITDTSGTGAAGTISLDGGPAIAFTSADANLRLTNSAGDAVFLNTTAITAGFNADVDVTANGAMSIDGGASATAITFNPNQAAADGSTGHVVYVDTSTVTRTGTETVNHPGTSDAFQSLITLRDQLRNVNHLSASNQITAISNQIGELESAHNNILEKMGQQSASLQTLGALQTHLQDMQTAARSTVSELGDVSASDVVVKLQAYQQMLQLSLATFARINGQSLLDFLK